MKRWSLGLALGAAVVTLVGNAGAQIIITEVVPGVSTSDTRGDVVEVHNAGVAAVDLTGYVLTDLDGTGVEADPMAEGTFAPLALGLPALEPGDFAVVHFIANTGTGSFIETNYGMEILAPLTAGSFLGDGWEELLLLDDTGTPLDFLAWADTANPIAGTDLDDAREDLQALTPPTGGYGLTPGVAAWQGADTIADINDHQASAIDIAGFTGVTGSGVGVLSRLSTNGVFQISTPRTRDDWEVRPRHRATLGNPSDDVTTVGGLRPLRRTGAISDWLASAASTTFPERRIARDQDLVTPDFQHPSGTELLDWPAFLNVALAGDWEATFAAAVPFGYEVVEFLDTATGNTFFVLRERTIPGEVGFRGQGIYVFDLSGESRPGLVLQAPHPIFDSDTLAQVALGVPQLRPRLAMFAGTHRNNALAETTCDGTFAGGAPYRVSDVAHHPDNFFHTTHVHMDSITAGMRAIQFHGFCCPGAGSYPLLFDDVVASNGHDDSPAVDAFVRLVGQAIEDQAFIADDGLGGDLTTVAIYPDDTTYLGARNNLQGRVSNGVAPGNECNTDAAAATGRFLHIEQDPDVREEPQHILTALLAVLLAEEAGVEQWKLMGE